MSLHCSVLKTRTAFLSWLAFLSRFLLGIFHSSFFLSSPSGSLFPHPCFLLFFPLTFCPVLPRFFVFLVFSSLPSHLLLSPLLSTLLLSSPASGCLHFLPTFLAFPFHSNEAHGWAKPGSILECKWQCHCACTNRNCGKLQEAELSSPLLSTLHYSTLSWICRFSTVSCSTPTFLFFSALLFSTPPCFPLLFTSASPLLLSTVLYTLLASIHLLSFLFSPILILSWIYYSYIILFSILVTILIDSLYYSHFFSLKPSVPRSCSSQLAAITSCSPLTHCIHNRQHHYIHV